MPNVAFNYSCRPALRVVRKVVGEGKERYASERRLHEGVVVYAVKYAVLETLFPQLQKVVIVAQLRLKHREVGPPRAAPRRNAYVVKAEAYYR